jgi:hypothetical protein
VVAILDMRSAKKITILAEDNPVIISIMLQFHGLSSFWFTIEPYGNFIEKPFCEKLLNQLNILHYMNVPWMVLHLIYYFGADQKSNMAARANNVF